MRERRDDARLLLGSPRRQAGGMYLLGYAIECALKQYIMRMLRVADLEAARHALQERYSVTTNLSSDHDLEKLLAVAETVGLAGGNDPRLLEAQSVAFRWTVDWRYVRRAIAPEDAWYFEQQVDVLYQWINGQVRRRKRQSWRRD